MDPAIAQAGGHQPVGSRDARGRRHDAGARALGLPGVSSAMDRERTYAIAEAAARAAHAKAGEYGDWAVRETGFGVAEHKTAQERTLKLALRRALSGLGLRQSAPRRERPYYRDPQTGGCRLRARPLHQSDRDGLLQGAVGIDDAQCHCACARIRRRANARSTQRGRLAEAAEAAGAPEAVIQVIEQPNIPLINEFMQSEKTDVILATGGTAMVRAAYSSSNPAIGVGPGNAPVMVDGSADIAAAARHIVDSKGVRQFGAVHQRVRPDHTRHGFRPVDEGTRQGRCSHLFRG